MKMTIDQYNLIIEILKKEQEIAERTYQRKKDYYKRITERFYKENPDATDKEMYEGFREQREEKEAAWNRLKSIEAVILKLENTEI